MLKKSKRSLACAGLLALVASGSSLAADHGHHMNAHNLGVFVGSLDTDHGSENVLGLEYEFRFNSHHGGGITYEDISDLDAKVKVLNYYYRPDANWRIGFGLGKESSHGHSENLKRVSLSYDVHLGSGWGLAPSIAVDFVNGESNTLLGVALVKSF